MKAKKAKGRGDDDLETKVGWRMAALGSETVSHVLAGGLLGWILDKWFGTDFLMMYGAIAGIATGIVALIRGSLKMNRRLDEELAARRTGPAGAAGGATGGADEDASEASGEGGVDR